MLEIAIVIGAIIASILIVASASLVIAIVQRLIARFDTVLKQEKPIRSAREWAEYNANRQRDLYDTAERIKTLAEHREPINEPVTDFETNPPKAYLWKD